MAWDAAVAAEAEMPGKEGGAERASKQATASGEWGERASEMSAASYPLLLVIDTVVSREPLGFRPCAADRCRFGEHSTRVAHRGDEERICADDRTADRIGSDRIGSDRIESDRIESDRPPTRGGQKNG